ncbi:MAG: caspase family protein, partial [Pseudomonadota bacterium]|nr:caspase family protein [Pseudomonadota bacterium]
RLEVHDHTDRARAVRHRAVVHSAPPARHARIGLVYFAGHGIQIQGNAYLVPVDVSLEDDRDVRRLFPAEYLLQDASQASQLGVVILDACRDNPFLKRVAEAAGATRSMVAGRGLARISDVPRNTLIAYATQSGNIALDGDGENSPYAQALIKHLPAQGKDVRLVFGAIRDEVIAVTKRLQEPYTYGSLGGDAIVINNEGPPAGTGQAATQTPSGDKVATAQLPDLRPQASGALTSAYAEWRAAVEHSDWDRVATLRKQHPDSLFGLLAGEIGGRPRSSGSVSEALAELSKRPLSLASLGGEWPYQIQTRLSDLNYFGDGLDSKFTPKSRAAFTAFTTDEAGGASNFGSLLRLAELSELRPAQSPLTGLWKGEYRYPKPINGVASVKFEMDLTFSQGQISGFITEPNTFGKPGSANLYASFTGYVVGNSLQWKKTYDGTAGVSHSVEYAGTLDRKTRRIKGHWTIRKDWSGEFDIALE